MSKTIIEEYGNTKAATDAIDYVQEKFECCGALSYTQWLLDFKAIPTSCCKVENCIPLAETVYEKGCVEALDDWGKKNLLILGGLSLGLLVFELIPMCLACCLRKMIKDD
ncbi:CD63 antigen-like isoform X1 [Anneissia japonica]|uniref:CD63 antigen-like isoform X1 n=1 Tax=Anneissia japonica TaxID=1529436 RepID=UPI001425B99A|nr:CD63 antigen-like isoform X1 [Anneissia japonica]